MSNFSWGILGPGGIAQAFAKDLSFIEGHTIGAVGSRTISNAQKFASTFGGTAYGSYEELVADSTIDAIYVATPHPAHHDNVILALNAGKPVLCEKPFAVNAKQAQAMVDTAAKNQVALMEAMWTRFLPTMDAVFEVINSGLIGTPNFVFGDHSQYLPIEKAPRLWNREQGGGAHYDLGIYPVSFAIRVLGFPDSVSGKSVMTDTGVDAATAAVMHYNNGSLAVINSCMTMAGTVSAAVHGTKGRLELDGSFY